MQKNAILEITNTFEKHLGKIGYWCKILKFDLVQRNAKKYCFPKIGTIIKIKY